MNTEEPAAVWADADSLVPWDKNPRKNAAAIAEVAESIKRFGFASPIIARTADRMVIAGHTRLAAAKSLGIQQVPVRFVDLDPADARLLALADNKLGEIAEWDAETLAQVLKGLDDDGASLGGLGWDEEELGSIIEGAASVGDDEWGEALGALPEGDRAPIRQMAFILHDDQAEEVARAVAKAKAMGPFVDTGNENGNGNAIARICELFNG